MSKTILALGSMHPKDMERLSSAFEVIRLWKERDPEYALKELSAKIEVILSTYNGPQVSDRMMAALPNLSLIAQYGAGVNNIDLDAARARQITVTHTPDILTEDTADIALSLILSCLRRVVEADMYVRVGRWVGGTPFPMGRSIRGKRLGIVGMGRIGQAIAKRCAVLGMEIAWHGPNPKPEIDYPRVDDVLTLARHSDVLVLACPGGEETRHMITLDHLEALGKEGYIINIARGSVIAEEDLLIALRNEAIAGAGLDVHAREPDVHPAFFKMDNVVLLPHIGSLTHETRRAMGQMVIDSIHGYFKGTPLPFALKSAI